MSLSDSDAAKLTKLLGMLNSEFEGERANAGKLADKFLRERGLRWGDVIPSSATAPRRPTYAANDTDAGTDAAKVVACLKRRDQLNEWELKFCLSLKAWRRLTEKQRAKLNEIHARVCS